MNIIPTILEKKNNKEYAFDLYSRMLQDRIIFLEGEINDATSVIIVSELLYLDNINNDDIYLYINSPGGSITSGMAIYDTMKFIKSNVITIGLGMCASMAAFLLSSGTKGKRYILPHSEFLIHQARVPGVSYSVNDDLQITAKHLDKNDKIITEILAKNTGKSYEQLEKDMSRDNWMSAKESVEYGLCDEIITKIEL